MDKKYWENFYKQHNEDMEPSSFARYICEHYAKPNNILIELGCGNGRDAVFFANEGLSVTAIDQCGEEIKFLTARYEHLKNINFYVDDFSSLSDQENVNLVYSRFTLHSISKEQEQRTLAWAYGNLTQGTFLFIEARKKCLK
jgi:ubiquinone/menaquinone biosynthesis C-methylase UbiE